MSDQTCDFGRAAGDYVRHRAGFPDWFFDRLTALGVEFKGRRALDLGTGTGLLARALAERGALVTGIDISPGMIEAARAIEAGAHPSIAYKLAPAEATGEPDGAFDLVSAATCWHWFDRPRVAGEAMRVLAPGGALIVCSLDWLPLPGNLVGASEALVQKHNPAWSMGGGDGLKPNYVRDLREAGFENAQCFGADCRIAYSHEGWKGRMRASAGVGASLDDKGVAAFDADLGRLIARDFPQEPLMVDHCAFAAIGWKRK